MEHQDPPYSVLPVKIALVYQYLRMGIGLLLIKRPLRDASLCMGDLQAPPAPPAPPAPHFVFLITL